jgi:hypothetical protein
MSRVSLPGDPQPQVTPAPGQYGESQGVCAIYSSGVGSVGWTIQ